MKQDPLGVIEAIYRVDLDARTWLAAVGDAIYDQMGAGLGVLAFEYQVTEGDRLRVGDTWERDMPSGLVEMMRGRSEHLPDWFVRETYARCAADTASQGGGSVRVREHAREGIRALARAFGRGDIFIVSGIDPTRHGVYVGAWLGKETRLPPRTRATWNRIAVHLAAGHRLRRRLTEVERSTPDSSEAILAPDGRVAHARAGADGRDARRTLRAAVLDVERARGPLRETDADQAVERWRGLVSGRWSLVDHFESDGKRYVLARRNDVPVGGLAALTVREHQATGYAALGHGNKLIAYEMGISPSTVGVLLHRASQKLGAASREDLIARFNELSRSRS